MIRSLVDMDYLKINALFRKAELSTALVGCLRLLRALGLLSGGRLALPPLSILLRGSFVTGNLVS
jgi:hypothetical protein